MTKSNKGIILGIAAILVISIVAVSVALINKNNSESGEGNGNNTAQTTNYDFSQIDKTIYYGDFDGMKALSSDIQNGRMTGKVVKIEGEVIHPGFSYSIGERSEDGSTRYGTTFEIDGADTKDYPEDEDKVTITGIVVESQPMLFIIKTTPEYVTRNE